MVSGNVPVARKPDLDPIGDENPEWTEENFNRPAFEVRPPDLHAALTARRPGQRGPQKAA